MTSLICVKPATEATVNGLQEVDHLGGRSTSQLIHLSSRRKRSITAQEPASPRSKNGSPSTMRYFFAATIPIRSCSYPGAMWARIIERVWR
jgi:hypothetical protein